MLQEWHRYYAGNLRVMLPDAFGTTGFLPPAPDWVASDWTGFRLDLAPPIEGGAEIIAWWRAQGQGPAREAADLLRRPRGRAIEATYHRFDGRVRMSFGWGTMLTNDFRDCAPQADDPLEAISSVCKVGEGQRPPGGEAFGQSGKATGPPEEIARYKRVFGGAGRVDRPVLI